MVAVAETFEARRAAVEQGLAVLRGERAGALLEGREFDHRRITDAEQALVGLDEAEAEAERRERVTQWAAAEQRKQEIVAAIVEAEERRLANVARAEKAAREFAEAVRDTLADAAAIEAQVALLDETAGNRSTPLQPMHLQPRLSANFAGVLRVAMGADNFGHLRIARVSGEPEVGADWVASERKEFAGYLEWVRRVTTKAKAA